MFEERVTAQSSDAMFRVLTLDGGGAKGFYTLGVLAEIEGMIERRLCERFDLIYGTSTGAIIGSLLALGYGVAEIQQIYARHVPPLMGLRTARTRSRALRGLAKEIFGDRSFEHFKTGVGIVTARWFNEWPMIFKNNAEQSLGHGKFRPGFGVSIADAVTASCSAFPFFLRTTVTTATGDRLELIDGGYCANNPTLYAIADAVGALKRRPEEIRLVNVGVGVYPQPRRLKMWLLRRLLSVRLLEKTLEINANSMDRLRQVLYQDIPTVRISETFNNPSLAADLMENDEEKLNRLQHQGRLSFVNFQAQLHEFLL